MKKYFIIPVLGGLLFCTGCTEKKMECVKEKENEKSTINLNFDGDDKLESAVTKIELDLKSFGVKKEDIDKAYLETVKKEYEKKGFLNISVSNNDTSIIVEYELDLKDKNTPRSFTDAKEQYSYEGYTCK